MKLMKKLKNCLVLLLIINLFISVSWASPGKYASLKKDERIPWNGWCFDNDAMAKILAEKELLEQSCQLKIDKAKEKLQALHLLKEGELKAEMDYEIKTRQDTIEALKVENLRMENAIVHEHKFGWIAPATLGLIIGAVTTFLITL